MEPLQIVDTTLLANKLLQSGTTPTWSGSCHNAVAKIQRLFLTTKHFLIKSQKKFLSVRKSVCLCIRFLKRAKAQHEWQKRKREKHGRVISYLSLDHLILISDGSHKQIKSISYPPHRHLRGSSSCCSLVVQLLSSCCPVIDWTTTEEEEDMNRTRTGRKVGINWNKI